MPQPTPIILTDGTTPVTLNPIGRSQGKTSYRGTAAVVAAANETLSFQQSFQGQTERQFTRYIEPVVVVDADTGESVVRDNVIITTENRIPGACTPAQRIRAIKRAFSLAEAAALEVELTTGEGHY